jgi:hypothetical protein
MDWYRPTTFITTLGSGQLICFQEAELTDPHKDPRVVNEHWKGHLNLCMEKKGWSQKAIE